MSDVSQGPGEEQRPQGQPQPAGPPPGSPPGGAAPSGGSSLPAYKADTANLTTADWVTGVASLVLLISLFLPWFSVNTGVALVGTVTASGESAHGYLWLVFFLCIVVIIFEALKIGWGKMPFKTPIAEEHALLIITVINLVLVVLAFLFKPGTGYTGVDIKIGWSYGAFVALIAAVAAALPLIIPAVQARRSS